MSQSQTSRGQAVMPLTMLKAGEEKSIKKVGGREETRQFLSKLGFIPGSHLRVINEINGNLIVNIKESRVAISREMAVKIMV
jgi:ferrous iron transport protein A